MKIPGTHLLFAIILAILLPRAGLAQPAATVRFNQDVRPILASNCFACHGLDANKREADLRLDEPDSAYAVAIKPGDPDGSEFWLRVTAEDEDLRMPPPSSHKQLTEAQKEILRRWIEQGAPYQKHWAFEPPIGNAPPAVRGAAWTRNAVDRFILARLESEGLQPRPEADKETLIRRVAFAATGLPPTLAAVDAFLKDDSPDAYERVVDGYLATPHFGEEMARHWLDVARYADTHGLHLDNERHMWAYRDWVVRAFNDNLPFDQFTLWQIAGDLLPSPTLDQLAATGFNRCNVTTSEGGAIDQEFLYRYAVDRASTMIQAWMGLTGGCAVCHDHKYDPLTMREFYSLYAFFYSAADPAMDGNVNNTGPFLRLPKPGQQEALDAATAREAQLHEQLEQLARELPYADPAQSQPSAPEGFRDVLFDDFFPLGTSARNTSRNASEWDADPALGVPSGRRALRQANSHFHEEVLQSQLRPITVPASARFEVWLRVDPRHVPRATSIVLTAADGSRRISWGSPDAFGEDEAVMKQTVGPGPLPAPGEWTKLAFTAAELGLAEGQRITSIALQEAGGIVHWDALTLSGQTSRATDPLESFAAWWKNMRSQVPADVPHELHALIAGGPDKDHTPEMRQSLLSYYLAHVARARSGGLAQLRREWEEARTARLICDDAISGTMTFGELAAPREAFVMLRGQYDKPGEKVEPGVPAVLPPLHKGSAEGRATRLDLARWLTSPEHPLAARVTVNRFWQQFFGTGIVKTSFDFGSQGESPSHPELLDRLAVDFRESGWDVKRLVKTLMTSATFRQRSAAAPELRQRDPDNRLYARGPRFRLDAEQIRDNALFVSGLMDPAMGGPGVKPYQPINIWEPVGYSDSNTRYYLQDYGPALYRRSLYCFLKRTAPPPFMSNFDGPNREQFCTRRERSNTPLQALQLMNDVQHFEAARALAERVLAADELPDDQRLTRLFRTVLSRPPDSEELRLLKELLARQRELFAADPQAASQAIRVGQSVPQGAAPDVEIAAWTLVVNLVLNLDETLTRN